MTRTTQAATTRSALPPPNGAIEPGRAQNSIWPGDTGRTRTPIWRSSSESSNVYWSFDCELQATSSEYRATSWEGGHEKRSLSFSGGSGHADRPDLDRRAPGPES